VEPPKNLRCEYRATPMGIDIVAPRLSWEVNDSRRGAVQSAYQIQVSTDPTLTAPNARVWDTGKVDSDQSIQLAYAGKPLSSRERYYWRVRTWDADGQPSGFSAPSWWEMGLLNPADWSAQWICTTRPYRKLATINWGDWIWDAPDRGEHQTTWLRRTFDLDDVQQVTKAVIRVTADDQFTLYLNGRTIGQRAGWNIVTEYTITPTLQTGANVLAIRATNQYGDYGCAVSLRIEMADGTATEILSGPEWRASAETAQNWQTLEFDDSKWKPAAIVAKYGDAPWGHLKQSPQPREAIYLRKGFKLKGPIKRARAYVTGLGIYELHLNGQRVGNDIMAPGWTHYLKRVQYQTYDITTMLTPGDNAVGAILGNGWWSGGMGWKEATQYADSDLRLLCQLQIEYVDGTRETIVSDPSWKGNSAPITRNTYYHGETYDARREMPGWDAAGFDETDWRPTLPVTSEYTPALVAQQCETMQVTATLEPMQISEPDAGVYIFDFGQNASGRARLTVRDAKPGTRIRMRFGEELDPDGRLYRDNYRSAQATDYYICKGGPIEVWEPAFTYRGFRYCEVTGLPSPPNKSTLAHRVLHSATPNAGAFGSSNWLINRIHQNVWWGLISNLHSVPTDCPQRDERLGWMGDAQTFAHTSCYLRNMASFYTKWMFDITD